jgi:acyl-CoA synthetase (NDP forming)
MSGNAFRTKRKSNLLTHRRPLLNAMFAPESVAVIGATEAPGSVGRALVENLKAYDRPVDPVNPKRNNVLGLRAFPTLNNFLPPFWSRSNPVDLAGDALLRSP